MVSIISHTPDTVHFRPLDLVSLNTHLERSKSRCQCGDGKINRGINNTKKTLDRGEVCHLFAINQVCVEEARLNIYNVVYRRVVCHVKFAIYLVSLSPL